MFTRTRFKTLWEIGLTGSPLSHLYRHVKKTLIHRISEKKGGTGKEPGTNMIDGSQEKASMKNGILDLRNNHPPSRKGGDC